jgi:phage N-6-adenine-methyltransferase
VRNCVVEGGGFDLGHPQGESEDASVSAPRFMPQQKPGRSVQEVGTPRELLDAVEARFGFFGVDLAALKSNRVVGPYCGPDHHNEHMRDALGLACQWNWSQATGLRWLNPPYNNIAPWAEKCAEQSAIGPCRIAFLVPASVGSNWFADHVDGKALVLFLRPRLTFVGHTQCYPKDLILALYGEKPGYECWRWRA